MSIREDEVACKNAAVLIVDQGYFPAALFVCHRLSKLAQNFDIVVVTVGFAPDPVLIEQLQLKTVPLELDHRIPTISSRKDRSAATYGRMLLDEVLPAQYERILYLDADIWIDEYSIGTLFEIDMRGFPVAAVPDAAEIQRPDDPAWIDYKAAIGHGASVPYFNAGVMLIDRAKYVSEDIGTRAVEYLRSGAYVGRLDDQSALNVVLRERWLALSPIWNWTVNGRPWLRNEFEPRIIHFIGRHKPWRDGKGRTPSFVVQEMKAYLDTLGLGTFVPPRTPVVRMRSTIRNVILRLVDIAGLDRRAYNVRRFMRAADSNRPTVKPD